MSRFVVLLHECPSGVPRTTHCDLMVEHRGVLRTWAVQQLPHGWGHLRNKTADETQPLLAVALTEEVVATRLADHRLDYLQYEGPVSGDRGTVRRLDAGTFELVSDSPAASEMQLAGEQLRGQLKLVREGQSGDQWRLKFIPENAQA